MGPNPFSSATADTPEVNLLFVPPHSGGMEIFMRRMVTIQDISCVGKCSLTVALPIISAMGTETCVIPTAVLSTHTAFNSFTFHDLTDEIEPIANNWKEQGMDFSCIYTGYLGSERQLRIVSDFIDDFGKNGTVFIDPVMGDFGKLYSGFEESFARKMAELCAKADVIVPNLTEACYLLGVPFHEVWDEEEIKDILRRLCGLGAKNAVLTGVEPEAGKMGAVMYNSVEDRFCSHFATKTYKTFHGTGDVFASTCVGGLCRGMSLKESLALAVDFTAECARITVENPSSRWYGVDFENAIPWLVERMK